MKLNHCAFTKTTMYLGFIQWDYFFHEIDVSKRSVYVKISFDAAHRCNQIM